MKKSLTKQVDLQTAIDYLNNAARKLRDSGEGVLAMRVSGLAQTVDLERLNTRQAEVFDV